VAEYAALQLGLREARRRRIRRLSVRGDSLLVVKQTTAQWRVHAPHLQPICAATRVLWESFPAATRSLRHVRRTYNHEAHLLADEAIEQRRSWEWHYGGAITAEQSHLVVAEGDIEQDSRHMTTCYDGDGHEDHR